MAGTAVPHIEESQPPRLADQFPAHYLASVAAAAEGGGGDAAAAAAAVPAVVPQAAAGEPTLQPFAGWHDAAPEQPQTGPPSEGAAGQGST